jgi:hypothetical protein
MDKIDRSFKHYMPFYDKRIYNFLNRSFPKKGHILGHKANLKKHKNNLIPCVLISHNKIKLEINGKKNHKTIQTHGDGTTYFWLFNGSLKILVKKLRNS